MAADNRREPQTIKANGLEFAYFEDGPVHGPLALCLHGFPDSATTWRHLLPLLGERGYHAVAPFTRGYAPTDLPHDGCYQTGALVRDVVCLHDAFDADESAVLIGHDWGALAAYGALAFEPGRWRRAVTAAVGPPASMMQGLLTYDQMKRSWYMFAFQTFLADLAIPLDGYNFIDRLWADWSPRYDAKEDVLDAKESIATPERMSAAIGYYRALFQAHLLDPDLAAEQDAAVGLVPHAVLYVHGDEDGCFGLESVGDPLSCLGEGSQFAVIEGAGHWPHLEKPDEVNPLILSFLGPPI